MTEFITGEIKIGTHNGWDLVYYPHNNSFGGTKGRKSRNDLSRDRLIGQLDDADAEDLRKQRRLEPVEFVRWDPKKQAEEKVRMTSFSNRGVALKPVDGGDTFYLERDRWGSRDGTMILVVRPGQSTKRLHQAVEGLRRAQEELRQAENEVVAAITVKDPGYGSRVADFHIEEDRLRAEIAKVTK